MIISKIKEAMITNQAWYKIAENVSELKFSADGLTEIKIGDRTVCITHHNNELFACTQKCPHAGGALANGYIDAVGNIVCPVHRYKFSLKNGRNVSGEGYFLKLFIIEERTDGVFILI